MRHAIAGKTAENLESVVAAVRRCGALSYTRDRARHYHDLALECLHRLPAGEARSAMAKITDLSINRDH